MLKLLPRIKLVNPSLPDGYCRHMSSKRGGYISDKMKESWNKPFAARFDVSHNSRRAWFRFFSENSDWTLAGLWRRFKMKTYGDMVESHKVDLERHKELGAELSCAFFIVMTGGAVKLNSRLQWIRMDKETKSHELPGRFVKECCVEGIDCSNVMLTYTALSNFRDLKALKYLKLCNMQYINDQWLGTLHQYADTLEFLDISDNKNLTERGLLSLHKLPNLKVAKIDNCPNIRSQQYIATLLEDHNPNLSVIGVTEPIHSDLIEIDNQGYDIQTIESRYLTLGEDLDEIAKAKRIEERRALQTHTDNGHLDSDGEENVVLGSESASSTQPLAGVINR